MTKVQGFLEIPMVILSVQGFFFTDKMFVKKIFL